MTKARIGIVGLWLVAATASYFFLTADAPLAAYLVPIYFMCGLGSFKLVQQAQQAQP